MVQFSPMTQALMMNNRRYLLGERPSIAENLQTVQQVQNENRLRQAQSDRYNAITQEENRKRAVLSQLDPNDPNAIPILLKAGLYEEAANLQKLQNQQKRMDMFQGGNMDGLGMVRAGIALEDPSLIQGGKAIYDIEQGQSAALQETLAAQEIQNMLGGNIPQRTQPDISLNEQGLPYSKSQEMPTPATPKPIQEPTTLAGKRDQLESQINQKMQQRAQLTQYAATDVGKAQQEQLDKEISALENQLPSRAEIAAEADALDKTRRGNNLVDDSLYYIDRLLQNTEGVARSSGPIGGKLPDVSESAANAAADMDALRSLMTVENLGIMSGVLSESDIKLIADIKGGGLKSTRSDARVIGELKRLKTALLRSQAEQAIKSGKNEAMVKSRFKEMTGSDL